MYLQLPKYSDDRALHRSSMEPQSRVHGCLPLMAIYIRVSCALRGSH